MFKDDLLNELLAHIGCGSLVSRTPITDHQFLFIFNFLKHPELGFPHLVGPYRSWDYRLGAHFVGVVNIWENI